VEVLHIEGKTKKAPYLSTSSLKMGTKKSLTIAFNTSLSKKGKVVNLKLLVRLKRQYLIHAPRDVMRHAQYECVLFNFYFVGIG
jgi:hypothetical protein